MDEKIIEELAQDKIIEKEALKLSEGYRKVSQPDVDYLIGLHEKKIAELEQSKIDPQIEVMEKKQKRIAVLRHMAEQELNDDILSHRFSQNDINRSEQRGMI